MLVRYAAAPYIPSASRSGSEAPSLLRASNLLLRGTGSTGFYLECYRGSADLGETIPEAALTGTISFSPASKIVTGSGTAFLTELHPGQFLLTSQGDLLVVSYVLSDTSFEACSEPSTTRSGASAVRPPVIWNLDRKRATAIRGSAIQFEKGHILGVGDGTLRLNGSALSGTSLTLSRAAKLALRNATTGNFDVFTLGMNAPSAVTLAAAAGGTKAMPPGPYSIRVVPYRSGTGGFNNPSPKSNAVTLATNERIEITFNNAMDTANGQDGYIIYGTTNLLGVSGPWYKIRTITKTDLIDGGHPLGTESGTKYLLEWLTGELDADDLLTFDNFPPPDSEFVTTLAGYPVYLSCFGAGTAAKPGGTSPGPKIAAAKITNIEAVLSTTIATEGPETIIGGLPALGRLFVLTPNRLQATQFTERASATITMRPFWNTGFFNPYSLIFVNGRLYGVPLAGPTRSVADGDTGQEEHDWAAAVQDDLRDVPAGRLMIAHDPRNEFVCVIAPAYRQNAGGWWVSRIWCYSLPLGVWTGPVEIESASADRIISGVATVNNEFVFIAGGRTSTTNSWKTYRFDARQSGSTETITWSGAWQIMDFNQDRQGKRVDSFQVTSRGQNTTAGVFLFQPSDSAEASVLDQSVSVSASGTITVSSTSSLQRSPYTLLNLPDAPLLTVKIQGSWNGSGQADRVDEVALEVVALEGMR